MMFAWWTDMKEFYFSVIGHKGNLVFGMLKGKFVVCMQGRFHPYEHNMNLALVGTVLNRNLPMFLRIVVQYVVLMGTVERVSVVVHDARKSAMTFCDVISHQNVKLHIQEKFIFAFHRLLIGIIVQNWHDAAFQ
jgi:hypothetical protein